MKGDVLEAVEAFYNSVGEAYDYDTALKAYSASADDTGVALSEFSPLTFKVTIHAARHLDPQALEGWRPSMERCPAKEMLIKAVGRIPMLTPIMRRTVVPDSMWEQSVTYRRTCGPWGYHDDGSSILSKSILKVTTCGFARLPGQDELGPDSLGAMTYMNKHLARAISLQQRLSQLEEVLIQSSNVLDLLDFGLVMFGAGGQLEFINASAKRMFHADDGLSLVEGKMTLQHSKLHGQFGAILDALCRDDVAQRDQVGGTLSAPMRSGRGAYTITITPIRNRHAADSNVKAVAFIFDPRKKQISVQKSLSDAYGLTPAEATLASALVQGQTLAAIAEHQGVSYNTVKTHLHAVFSKTRTKRQGELISLLLGSLAGMNINTSASD